MCKPGKAALQSRQCGMAADRDSEGTLHRYYNGANGARPKNGVQSRRKYRLLAPEETVGDPAAEGTQVRGYGHGAIRSADVQGRRATDTGHKTRQCAFVA